MNINIPKNVKFIIDTFIIIIMKLLWLVDVLEIALLGLTAKGF